MVVQTEGGIDQTCLSFRSATEAVPGSMTFISIATAMLGAIMFGIDAGNFGATINFHGFKEHWCVNAGWGYPNNQACEDPHTHVKDYSGKCHLGPGCYATTGPDSYMVTFITFGNVLITAGAAVAAIGLSGKIADKHGRRMCISMGCAVVVVGCILTIISGAIAMSPPTDEQLEAGVPFGLNWLPIAVFYISRFITGFGIGLCCYALPMYSAEIATPGIRGRAGGLFQLNVVIGGLIASLVTDAMDNWHVGIMLPAMAGIVVTFLIWIVPESPRWALKNQGPEAAAKILRRVRKGDVNPELATIQEGLDAEKDLVELTFADLMKPGLRTRVFVACFMQVAQQLTGVNAILGLSSLFFGRMGMPEEFNFFTIFNLVMVFGVLCGLAILDSPYGGRRRQLMIAAIVMGPPLFIAAGTLETSPWQLGAAMIALYGWGFQFAWGTVPWVYPSEIFTMSERTKAMGLAVFFQYGMNTAVYWISPALVQWSMRGTLVVFGCFNFLGLIFIIACVKETKGVPLEMVPQLFSRNPAMAATELGLSHGG